MELIKKAIIPVAGLGTRFLPATKAMPKELLPIVDKPLIQYVVEEAIAAGIEQIVFITSSSKRAIEDYFDRNFELEELLKQKGKVDLIEKCRVLPDNVNYCYVRQGEPKGLGQAILCAQPIIGDDPFAILLADDLIVPYQNKYCLQNLIANYYETNGGSTIAVETVAPEMVSNYGIVEMTNSNRITSIIEKPSIEDAPSNQAVIGRYVFSGKLFSYLEKTQIGLGGEIQLTDAIASYLQNYDVYAHNFLGKRFDCGMPTGYMEANMFMFEELRSKDD